jgi:gluconate 2-dehydrogenase gamma chain
VIKNYIKYHPKTEKIKRWTFSRRNFIKGSIALSILSQIPINTSCKQDYIQNNVLSKEQYKTIIIVQNILFPEGGYGPSAKDFNAHLYIIWILQDPYILKEDKDYILDGIRWVQETAQEEFQQNFLSLKPNEQQKLIKHISTKSWGENWLSYIMTLIIEAMVSDPIYGLNKNSIGVKWLDHQYGIPQPNKQTKYPTIFKTIAKNE